MRLKRIFGMSVAAGLALSLLAGTASGDMITLETGKDLWVGKQRIGGNIQPLELVSEGDLRLQSFSSAKISSLLGGYDVSQLASVDSATLRFYLIDHGGDDAGSLGVRALTIDWDESLDPGDLDLNADGSLASGHAAEGAVALGGFDLAGHEGDWVELDITTIVQNWVNGTVGDADKGLLLTGGVWNSMTHLAGTESAGDFAPHIVASGTLVPEPASLALLVLGGLALVARRRGSNIAQG